MKSGKRIPRRLQPQTRAAVLAGLFLAVLAAMSIGTALLAALGPGGEAGQALTGLIVVGGLGLMLICALLLLHTVQALPGKPPRQRQRRGERFL